MNKLYLGKYLIEKYNLLEISYYRLKEPKIGNTLRGKRGLHALGNNSDGSEPIWMKSGNV